MAKPRVRQPQYPVGVPEPRKTGPIIAGSIIGLIVVFIGVALLIAQPWKDDEGSAKNDDVIEFQAVTVNGSALPPDQNAQGGGSDAAIGQTAPELTGKTFTGAPVEVKAGKPKVVMFFAHWCPHCQKELPIITQWLKDNQGKYAIDYYAVSTGVNSGRGNYPPSKWFEKEKFPLPVMADNSKQEAANSYGLASYPYLVFLDKDNKVVARNSSELTADQITELVKQIAPPA